MNGFVLSGYGLTVGALALYGVRVLLRERAARRALRKERAWS